MQINPRLYWVVALMILVLELFFVIYIFVNYTFEITLFLVFIFGVTFLLIYLFKKQYEQKIKQIQDIENEVKTGVFKTESPISLVNKEFELYVENFVNDSEFSFVQIEKTHPLKEKMEGFRENLKQIKKEEDERHWIMEGLNDFSVLLSESNRDLSELTYDIIFKLSKYVNAVQGGFYVLENQYNEEFLELVACYAYDKKRHQKKQYFLYEGWLGTAVLDKEIKKLSDLPDDYFYISSGLGEAPPRFVLVIPLIYKENVYGVIELVFFTQQPDYKVDFLNSLSKSIASVVADTKLNNQTKHLLADFQNMTAILKENELVLQQNMNDLKATKDLVLQSQNEMTVIFETLNANLIVLELDKDGRILKVNDNFIYLINKDKNDFIGQFLHKFSSANADFVINYRKYWDNLFKNDLLILEIPFTFSWTDDVTLNLTFKPVRNLNNTVAKVICIGTDITDRIRLENMFQVHQHELSSLIDGISKNIAVVEFDMYGFVVQANEMFLTIFGYTMEEMIGKRYLDFISEFDRNKGHYQVMWDNLYLGNDFEGEFKMSDKEGKEQWMKGTFNAVIGLDGLPSKVMMYAMFTTEDKEKAVELKSLISMIKGAMMWAELGTDGYFKTANPSFMNTFGYKRNQIKKISIFDWVDSFVKNSDFDLWNTILQQEISSTTLKITNLEGVLEDTYIAWGGVKDTKEQVTKYVLMLNPV